MVSPGIECTDLSFAVGEFSFEGLHLRVDQGIYFVLTGPNGAGKSILIKLICGILQPLTGSLCVNGEQITHVPAWERRIGYVPQEGALFPHLSVRANIEFGLSVRGVGTQERQKRTTSAAERVGVAHLLGRRIAGLSGGECQKVALARAIVIEPAVLLLDEPVSAIDEEARDSICRDLKVLQRELGITTLHVSHNRRETDLVADRIGIMRDGHIKADGS